MTDSAQHLADLKAFKAKLVEDRRAIVRKELDAVNRGGDILPSKFLEIQGEIEAVDRAIADEENIRRKRAYCFIGITSVTSGEDDEEAVYEISGSYYQASYLKVGSNAASKNSAPWNSTKQSDEERCIDEIVFHS